MDPLYTSEFATDCMAYADAEKYEEASEDAHVASKSLFTSPAENQQLECHEQLPVDLLKDAGSPAAVERLQSAQRAERQQGGSCLSRFAPQAVLPATPSQHLAAAFKALSLSPGQPVVDSGKSEPSIELADQPKAACVLPSNEPETDEAEAGGPILSCQASEGQDTDLEQGAVKRQPVYESASGTAKEAEPVSPVSSEKPSGEPTCGGLGADIKASSTSLQVAEEGNVIAEDLPQSTVQEAAIGMSHLSLDNTAAQPVDEYLIGEPSFKCAEQTYGCSHC